MNDPNPLIEANATLALGDLMRRERLLKIVQGKPTWKYYAFCAPWLILLAFIFYTEKANTMMLLALIPMLTAIGGAYMDCSRRMNALIELLGEEDLRKPKTGD